MMRYGATGGGRPRERFPPVRKAPSRWRFARWERRSPHHWTTLGAPPESPKLLDGQETPFTDGSPLRPRPV